MLRILKKITLTTFFAVFASQASALFIQPDWFDPTQPGVGTNRYAYSGNDPVNRSDPNGNFFTWEDVRNTVGRLFGESQDTRNERYANALSDAQNELNRFQDAVNAGEYDHLSGIAINEALDARRAAVDRYSRRVNDALGANAVDFVVMGGTLAGLKGGASLPHLRAGAPATAAFVPAPTTQAAIEAAERLGINLADVTMTNGVASTTVSITNKLLRQDIKTVTSYLQLSGANSARLNTGNIANPALNSVLERAVGRGPQEYLGGGSVVRGPGGGAGDFFIDFVFP